MQHKERLKDVRYIGQTKILRIHKFGWHDNETDKMVSRATIRKSRTRNRKQDKALQPKAKERWATTVHQLHNGIDS